MSLHVVFSAECNPSMTWQAIALFHSFRHVGQVGNITRLLACSAEQLKSYNGMDVGPTFVHHNMRFGHELIDETGYPSYNKPASVMFFLQEVDVQEDYIALLDTDMLLRQPLDVRQQLEVIVFRNWTLSGCSFSRPCRQSISAYPAFDAFS